MKIKFKISYALITIFILVFFFDYFVLSYGKTELFTIDHIIYGNQWSILTDYGRLLNWSEMNGEVWRLFTSIFLHSGIIHLLVNSLMVYIVGSFVESKIGSLRTLLVFICSGILTSIITAFFTYGAVGASGSIFALIGIAFTIWYKDKKFQYSVVNWIKIILLTFYVIVLSLSSLPTMVAHISGLIFGIIINLLIEKHTEINRY